MAGSTQKKKTSSNQSKTNNKNTRSSSSSGSSRNSSRNSSTRSQGQTGKRKSRISVTEGSGNKKEIGAVLIIGFCILMIISLFGGAAIVGKLLRGIFLGLFGGPATVIMIIVAVAVSISILRGTEKKYLSFKRNLCFALFILSCSALIQTCTDAYDQYIGGDTGFIECISYLWDYTPAALSGGVIGGSLSFLLQFLMDKVASIVVLAVITIVLANILFAFSIVALVRRFAPVANFCRNKINNASQKIKDNNAAKKAAKDAEEDDDGETDDEPEGDDEASEKETEASGRRKRKPTAEENDNDDYGDDKGDEDDGEFIYQPIPYDDDYYGEEDEDEGEIIGGDIDPENDDDVIFVVPKNQKRFSKHRDGIVVDENGEIIEENPSTENDAEKDGEDSDAETNSVTYSEQGAEGEAETGNVGEKTKPTPEIHVPGTVADSSLDGIVFSKPQVVPYRFPSTDLLDIGNSKRNPMVEKNQAAATARKLEAVMKSFGIEARVTHYSIGPTVTRYEMIPSIGVRVNKIKNLSDDIALNLAATSIRIEAPIPGKSAIGIEVPNRENKTVYFREIIDSDAFRFNRSKLAACLGSGISGEPVVVDLAKMPHLMIAGTTGSGKSVCTNGIIMSMLFNASPEEVKFILIDPKMVEFSKYNGIPHLLLPVVTEPKKAASALAWAVDQMEKRYKLLAMYGVRDLKSYNAYAEKNGLSKMPAIVIIIDELADLMMVARDSVETAINRIAQKARAAGMHLVVATQRPSVDVITGLIKSNIPVRIALKVSSQVDSRTIIDTVGAEKLLGRGDMLYLAPEVSKALRIQGSYVSDSEIEAVVESIMQTSTADYAADVIQKVDEGMTSAAAQEKGGSEDGNLSEDEILFRKAVKLAIETKNISVSMLQRKFNIGFNRAGRIVDMMEERGVVSCKDGSNARKVLVDSYDFGSDE